MFVITLLGDFDEEVGTTYIQVRQHTASLSVLLGGETLTVTKKQN